MEHHEYELLLCPDDCENLDTRESRCDLYRIILAKANIPDRWEKCYRCRNKGE